MISVPQSIRDLDLRPIPPAKIDDGWEWQGDFPTFPERLAVFIETGKFPKKRWHPSTVTLSLRVNTAQFMESVRLASDFAKSLALIQKAAQR